MININKLVKENNGKILFEIEKYNINNDKKVITLLGNNGSGKTTLAKIISGLDKEYEGLIENNFNTLYFEQHYYFNSEKNKLSNGEKSKKDLLKVFEKKYELLILDEPSVNLDNNNRDFLINNIKKYKGVIILITHDRELLKEVSDEIIEIEDGKLNEYKMNYDLYEIEKENKIKQHKLEYTKYINKKNSLEKAILKREEFSKHTKDTPKRMSISEARLNKWSRLGKPSTDGHKKALKNKLSKLEDVNPEYIFDKNIIFNWAGYDYNKKIVDIEEFDLTIFNKEKIGIVGKNGVGKTTFLKNIYNKNYWVNQNIKIGYFTQYLDEKYLNNSVEEYININAKESIFIVRRYLAQFKYNEEFYYRTIEELSEGQKNQLNLAILLSKEIDLLLFDEPTNFLDLNSIKMLEEALIKFPGSVIIVTHDNNFMSKITDKVYSLDETGLKRI